MSGGGPDVHMLHQAVVQARGEAEPLQVDLIMMNVPGTENNNIRSKHCKMHTPHTLSYHHTTPPTFLEL